MSKIGLGDKVEHVVSGIVGIVVARTEWISGCWRMTIQPRAKEDGTLPEAVSFDDVEIKVLEKKAFQKKLNPEKKKKVGNKLTGGPRPEVSRGCNITR